MMVTPLILPGDPAFYETLENPHLFDYRALGAAKGSMTFVVRAETGLLDCVNNYELIEYIHGGEYQQRLDSIDSMDSC